MKKITILLLFIISVLILTACSNNTTTTTFTNPEENYCVAGQTEGVFICERRFTSYFDTILSLKIYVDSDYDFDINQIFINFEEMLMQYHKYFDKYNSYPDVNNLYTINNSDTPVVVDEELYRAIEYARDNEDIIVVDNTLLFNIALHPVLEVWHNARNSGSCDSFIELGVDYCPVPSIEIENASFNINPDDIILNKDDFSVGFANDNMGIDLGGFAKGYFSELVADYLNQYEINYILNLGNSNVYAHGVNLDKEDGLFYIALTTPFAGIGDSPYYAVVKLESGLNLVSSGNYQRYFKNLNVMEDETIYHHIIDPRTYYPGGEVTSLTVLYNDAAIGDILSTTLYLMTVEEGLTFVNNYPGLEALWYIDKDNIVLSENFEDYLMDPIS
ncbi:MAG: FAD:protein FMN transferase [Candidatus Izemoplasmatales bacterium]|nr:FAD:protein FMN transferase [Candidatus Izemoplasmatales bacterium]